MKTHSASIGVVAVSLTLALSAAVAAPPQEIVLYVAPEGDDAHSGRLRDTTPDGSDGPLATVAGAQRAIRRLRRGGTLPKPVKVLIRGRLWLDGPVVFEPEDSGTERCPIVYTTEKPRGAVLSGGRAIAGWKKTDGPIWTAYVPEVKSGTWYFRQMFVAGRRATRARTPNGGYLHADSPIDAKPGAKWNEGTDRFRFKPGDIRPWNDLHNVEVVVFHSWNTSRVRIASVDERARVVRFTGPTIFRPFGWDPEQRYYVENAAELLDAPGEWYLDRTTGVVSYWPRQDEDMTTAEVVAPRLTELLRFDGDPDKGRLVEHIRVEGLSFQHADWTLGPRGYGDPQAAVTVPAVVSATGARHCVLQGCEIAHVGTYGVWFSRGCKDCRIVRNHVHDLGAGGIRIGEPKMPRTDEAESSRNLIHNNYIHDGGRVYAAGVGIWLAQSSHNTISHNEIHSFDYSGMSIGWNWSDAPTRTLHNTIEQNHVHHVVRGVLSDGGGIYTLGTQTGTAIRNNVFHDIWPYMGRPAMAWGIYFDAGSNGLTAENNIVYHTLTGGIMNTAHPANVIRNNIFALSAWHAAWRYTWEREPSSVVERNIFYLTQGALFHNDGGRHDTRSRWDYNLYWRTDGRPMEFYDDDFAGWQAKGLDRHGRVADPRFVAPARFDFSLAPDSPALKLGFKPIDTSRVGLVGPPEWVDLPRRAKFPPTVLPPEPPPPKPVTVDDGFEKTAAGTRPALAVVVEEGRGDSIRVTDAVAAGGKHSLKLTDAAGLQHSFNPHLFYVPHFREGTARLSFDLRLAQGAELVHEWRDAASPYRVGPSIHVKPDGRIFAGGKPQGRIPLDKWVRVAIACGLGKQATGVYELTLTLPGQQPKTYAKLPCGTPKFDRLEWLGFVSVAPGKTECYLDNVKLELQSPQR